MRKWVRSEHSDVTKPERWILPSITSSDKSSAAQGTKAALTYFQRKHFIDCFFPIISFSWFQVHNFSFMQPRMSLWKIDNNDKEAFPTEQKAEGIQMMQRHENPSPSFLNSIRQHRQQPKHRELSLQSLSLTIWDTKVISGSAHL